jgi:hypothetical protein
MPVAAGGWDAVAAKPLEAMSAKHAGRTILIIHLWNIVLG